MHALNKAVQQTPRVGADAPSLRFGLVKSIKKSFVTFSMSVMVQELCSSPERPSLLSGIEPTEFCLFRLPPREMATSAPDHTVLNGSHFDTLLR